MDVHEAKAQAKEEKYLRVKAEEVLVIKETKHKKRWSSYADLEDVIKELPEFSDLVRSLANKRFDLATDEVRKLAPDHDLTLAYQAYEAELEAEEEDIQVVGPAADPNDQEANL